MSKAYDRVECGFFRIHDAEYGLLTTMDLMDYAMC